MGEADVVDVLLVLGPHSFAPDRGGTIATAGISVLGSLRARLTCVDASTERATVEALEQPSDAVVLAPGVLEHYSGWTADAVRRLDVPVVVAHDSGALGSGPMGDRVIVTPGATASVRGDGVLALEGAVEAAAELAWDRRRRQESAEARDAGLRPRAGQPGAAPS